MNSPAFIVGQVAMVQSLPPEWQRRTFDAEHDLLGRCGTVHDVYKYRMATYFCWFYTLVIGGRFAHLPEDCLCSLAGLKEFDRVHS